jgi:hypothetical protein
MIGMATEEYGLSATRSNWHVMVSRGKHSWRWADVASIPLLERIELTRPNVALLSSETADTIYSSLFKVRSIEGFNDFDIKGLANAQVPMAHFDLDGMSSNPLMVNHRIAMLKREVKTKTNICVSIWHCGNHQINLIDKYSISAASDRVYATLTTASQFLRMGSNFLHLIHGFSTVANNEFVPMQLGIPPADQGELQMKWKITRSATSKVS